LRDAGNGPRVTSFVLGHAPTLELELEEQLLIAMAFPYVAGSKGLISAADIHGTPKVLKAIPLHKHPICQRFQEKNLHYDNNFPIVPGMSQNGTKILRYEQRRQHILRAGPGSV
jgi:hypothetical protein